ncbi:Gfo/Idh/MocA family oxidoreductase (plasmid) [Halorussus limi]|uniref:Gfo/Idh/MocA family oxidoreductase n=1 Tax=Halorussus limi TaxID=2938695 RepID=A0A8U0HZT3_9EURY|nr:Gfo/Idh/MocA family oxidoreductase [Halorussus limi]UPV76437.1 Gfo/Idh/MocA family oxidoreductase [Halorussus limi]
MALRLGAVGLGGLGSIELELYDEMSDVTVVAGADVSEGAREAFADTYDAPTYESHERLLAEHDLDAVTIVTPHTLHYEQAMDCFEEGADVFLEKPMVTGIENAASLVAAAEERGRILQVGYQRHFDPLFRELKRVVTSDRIGRIHAANAYLGQDWIEIQRGSWRTDPGLSGGGQLYDSGSHLLDALLWTLDAEPRSVAAVTDDRGEAVDVNSALAATLHRDEGPVTASVGVVGDGTHGEPDEGMVLWGTEGHVRYEDGRLTVHEDGATYEGEVAGDRDFTTLTRRKLSDFVRAVEERTEPAVPGSFGLRVTAMTEAAYEAAETGRTVDVQARIEAARPDAGAATADD